MSYYRLAGDRVVGPLSADQIGRLVTRREIRSSDKIRGEDGQWKPLSEHPELVQAVTSHVVGVAAPLQANPAAAPPAASDRTSFPVLGAAIVVAPILSGLLVCAAAAPWIMFGFRRPAESAALSIAAIACGAATAVIGDILRWMLAMERYAAANNNNNN